jgi:hypothetical protein
MFGLTTSWFSVVRCALRGRACPKANSPRRCGARLAVEQFENRVTPSALASGLTATVDDGRELVAPIRISRLEPAALPSSAGALASPSDPTAGPPSLPPEPPTPPSPPGPHDIPPIGPILPIDIKVPEPPPL